MLLRTSLCGWCLVLSACVIAAVPEAVLTPPAAALGMEGAVGDYFGYSVVVEGDRAYVGVPFDDVGGAGDVGSVALLRRVGTSWQFSGKLIVPQATTQLFGTRIVVADGLLYVQGDYAIHVFDNQGEQPVLLDHIEDAGRGAMAVHQGTLVVGEIATEGAVVRVYTREAGGWVVQQELAPVGGDGDHRDFGSALALHGNRLAVGSVSDGASGAVYLYQYNQGLWTQTARIQPAPEEQAQAFGCSLAMDAQWLLAGACNSDNQGAYSGAVFVHTLGGPAPVQTQRLQPSVTLMSDVQFGRSLALDNQRLAIGAPDGQAQAGIDLYTLDNGSWQPRARLLAPAAVNLSRLGVAMAWAGDQLLAGMPALRVDGRSLQGALCLARIDGAAVPTCDVLHAGSGSADQQFGAALAADADTLVIGGPGHYGGYGDVRVFGRANGQWTPTDRLTGARIADDRFGAAVAIDGDLLVAGAPEEEELKTSAIGAVYPWRRQGGKWIAEPRLQALQATELARFGAAVAVSGTWLAVAAPSDQESFTGPNSGAVYLYQRIAGSWQLQTRIPAQQPGSFGFGTQVAMHGNRLLISAPYDDADNAPQSGKVYVFGLQGAAWVLQQNLTAPVPADHYAFGERLALHGARALIRSLDHDSGDVVHALVERQGTWQVVQQLPAPAANNAVAALSLDADSALVGAADMRAFGAQSGGQGTLYRWSGQRWTVDTVIDAPTGSPTHHGFAEAVVLTDHDILVSAPRQSASAPFGNPEEGAVYLTRRLPSLLGDGFESP